MRTILLLALLPLSAFAGCLDAGAAEVDPAALASDPPADAVAAPRVVDVAEEGATYAGACAWTPLTGCVGPAYGPDASAWKQPLDGALDAADLTMTWTAASPATEELIVGIAYKVGGEWKYEVESGASPLTLSRSGLGIPADAEVWVYGNAYKCDGAGAVAACLSPRQEFSLAGTLTVVG